MAAFAVTISLRQTIERLYHSFHFLISSSNKEILKEAYKEVVSLQKVLLKPDSTVNNSSEKLNDLDGQIRDAVCELEDALDSHVSDQFVSDCVGERSYPFVFSLDLQKVKPVIDSFTQKVQKLEEEYIEELSNPLSEDDEDDAVSSESKFPQKKLKMVGLDDHCSRFTDYLINYLGDLGEAVRIVGMAGIGKTALARRVFEDPACVNHFQHRVWVTIGRKYQIKRIMRDVLSQLYPDDYEMRLMKEETQTLEYLYKSLKGKRYLIVLDDVWDTRVFEHFTEYLPDEHTRSRCLLTTRLLQVAHYKSSVRVHCMKLLNEEESWDLLRENIFHDGSCPSHLVKAGKEIAKKCDGLPLTIVTVADILSKAERTPEYWDKIATEKQHSIFMDAFDQTSKVLYPSYNHLAQFLKPCFVYMGVFPQNYVINSSKLYKLWSAERFFEEDSEVRYMLKFFLNNVIIPLEKSSESIKSCRLHSVFWYLCNREAVKSKIFHVLSSYTDGSVESMEGERRLSVPHSVLFGMKNVYNSMASLATVRSIICSGQYHKYPVPICFATTLLKVLDALAIHFYQFPIEVLNQVHLKYLAITYNGKIPSSISKLWMLEYFIVRRHLTIRSSEDSSYLPVEIWEMQELKHLQITGSILPDPCGGVSLPNLLTLSDVSAHSCTSRVLESIPNLKKLGIRIELAPDGLLQFGCFDHISHLHQLESFKCVVVNPEIKFEVVTRPAFHLNFPSSLKKLSLSGLGYPWEYMSKIASLPRLEVLKLRSFAFRGPVWQINPDEFLSLSSLVLEDIDVVSLNFSHHRSLEYLFLRHCYKLKELCWEGNSSSDSVLELFDCDPSTSEQLYYHPVDHIGVVVHSSWEGSANPEFSRTFQRYVWED